MAEPDLLIEREEGYAILTLNRPAKLNAMNPPMWDDLPRLLAALGEDETVRVVVISGAGSWPRHSTDGEAILKRSEPAASTVHGGLLILSDTEDALGLAYPGCCFGMEVLG